MVEPSRIILVTGGARSGKSTFAERLACEGAPLRAYIATAPCLDDEMKERIARHKARRAGQNWVNLEEETDLISAVAKAKASGASSLLIDCLTLWLNNLLYYGEKNGELPTEDSVSARAKELVTALRGFPGTSVLVINEVGCGIVPENASARRFRDCSGRCAQTVAALADEVYFCAAGLQLRMK